MVTTPRRRTLTYGDARHRPPPRDAGGRASTLKDRSVVTLIGKPIASTRCSREGRRAARSSASTCSVPGHARRPSSSAAGGARGRREVRRTEGEEAAGVSTSCRSRRAWRSSPRAYWHARKAADASSSSGTKGRWRSSRTRCARASVDAQGRRQAHRRRVKHAGDLGDFDAAMKSGAVRSASRRVRGAVPRARPHGAAERARRSVDGEKCRVWAPTQSATIATGDGGALLDIPHSDVDDPHHVHGRRLRSSRRAPTSSPRRSSARGDEGAGEGACGRAKTTCATPVPAESRRSWTAASTRTACRWRGFTASPASAHPAASVTSWARLLPMVPRPVLDMVGKGVGDCSSRDTPSIPPRRRRRRQAVRVAEHRGRVRAATTRACRCCSGAPSVTPSTRSSSRASSTSSRPPAARIRWSCARSC